MVHSLYNYNAVICVLPPTWISASSLPIILTPWRNFLLSYLLSSCNIRRPFQPDAEGLEDLPVTKPFIFSTSNGCHQRRIQTSGQKKSERNFCQKMAADWSTELLTKLCQDQGLGRDVVLINEPEQNFTVSVLNTNTFGFRTHSFHPVSNCPDFRHFWPV